MQRFRANDVSDLIRRMRPVLLLTLLAIGALAGFAVHEQYLMRFQAKTSLPMSGDLATFREAELVRSETFRAIPIFKRSGSNSLDI
jgi:hypothetical protein